ncbi:hypothetical protein J7F01_05880 [Streptomyces sp. ISL-22]|uniref:hypothetical protein n=1 Tax=Streptomyces TaxID=1883 RepID=UPI00131E804A|nr:MULTISPECIES: hypothetical protein [Streptomyces]MBT2419953.1 hypothetical protein [Streptomyces sp. ISL-24]MBT2431736.1 hypothetical protein [Streptomyces sp. ISL-22]
MTAVALGRRPRQPEQTVAVMEAVEATGLVVVVELPLDTAEAAAPVPDRLAEAT